MKFSASIPAVSLPLTVIIPLCLCLLSSSDLLYSFQHCQRIFEATSAAFSGVRLLAFPSITLRTLFSIDKDIYIT